MISIILGICTVIGAIIVGVSILTIPLYLIDNHNEKKIHEKQELEYRIKTLENDGKYFYDEIGKIKEKNK